MIALQQVRKYNSFMDNIDEVLTRSVDQILPTREGLEKLMQTKKIRLYLGIDPTGTRLHLGHTVALRKLQQFADLGHEAILLIGTGTVLVGDPSQRSTGRPQITEEEIQENIKTWKEQAGKVINFSKVQIRQNGNWLNKLTYKDIVSIASHISAVQLFKRNMFEERIERGDTVWYHETMYPLLQGYDSVVMDVDLEIGGTDQTFNMLIGRELQQKINGKEKFVLTVPMIVGLDGRPMSKTSGNCVWLDDSPGDMFGKIMSMRDESTFGYMMLLTNIPLNDVQSNEKSPLEAKKRLAWEIVKMYHGEVEANKARVEFERVFQKRETPIDITVVEVAPGEIDITTTLVENKLAKSRAEAKRLLEQKALELGGVVLTTPMVTLERGQEQLLKVGKHRFIQLLAKG